MGHVLTRRGLLGAALAGAAALPACSGAGEAPGGYGVGEVAPAADRGSWPGLTGIADASGEWVVTPRWAGDPSSGGPVVSAAGDTAAVRAVDGRGRPTDYGYVGCDGSWAVAPSLNEARGFSACGLAAAQAEEDDSGCGNDWGYPAPDGSWALGPGFSMSTGDFGADGSDADPSLPWAVERWPSAASDGLWGLRDQGGSWVLEPSLALLRPLLAERSLLARDPSSGLWGVASPDGSWEVGPSFRAVCDYAGGRVVAGATKDGPWGIASPDGTWLTEPAYSFALWMPAADVFLATVPEEG